MKAHYFLNQRGLVALSSTGHLVALEREWQRGYVLRTCGAWVVNLKDPSGGKDHMHVTLHDKLEAIRALKALRRMHGLHPRTGERLEGGG